MFTCVLYLLIETFSFSFLITANEGRSGGGPGSFGDPAHQHRFDESTISHFLSSAVPPHTYSQYPSPNMMPGYNHYYTVNHGPIPPTANMSTTAMPPPLPPHYYNQQHLGKMQQPYFAGMQPPLSPVHPLFPALHLHQQQSQQQPQQQSVCLRPGCVKAGKFPLFFQFTVAIDCSSLRQ